MYASTKCISVTCLYVFRESAEDHCERSQLRPRPRVMGLGHFLEDLVNENLVQLPTVPVNFPPLGSGPVRLTI